MDSAASSMIGTLLIGLLILAAVICAIVKLIRDRKKGKSSCGEDCLGCPYSGSCHKKGE